MSNPDPLPDVTTSGGLATVAPGPVHVTYAGRDAVVGAGVVRRLLPNLGRRLVGPWCFVDHYGPEDVADSAGMSVPPHPHMGLQTVSWLRAGAIHHRDSLGSDQVIHPGELGLMTAGNAITHAEHSPVAHPALLHGVQLWVALPSSARDTAPSWQHHPVLPVVSAPAMTATVLMGSVDGAVSPGLAYSPIVGADVALAPGADASLPLDPEFEHAVLATSGVAEVDGERVEPGSLLYLGCARRDLRLASPGGASLLLLGGAPFEERIVMWWNFVARSGAEIAAAREQWERGERFGAVTGAGDPLRAPALPPGELKPGGAVRDRG